MKLLTEVDITFTPTDPIKVSMMDSDSGSYLKHAENAIKNQPDDSPFFLVDLRDIQYKAMAWHRYLPRVKPFHALKINSADSVVDLLSQSGCGFKIQSKKELEMAQSLDLPADWLIFSNPCKPNSHIKAAALAGVNILTFDNDHELKKIKKLHPTAGVMLRISTDESDSEFDESFGASEADWPKLIQSARDLNLNLIGVTFHIGQKYRHLNQFPLAISQAAEVFKLAQCAGFDPCVLDLGGGFPPADDFQPLFEDVADSINTALSNHFSENCFKNLRIIAEPSEYLTGGAFSLVTQVTSVVTPNQNGKTQIYINDGIYGNFGTGEPSIPKVLKTQSDAGNVGKYSIWGASMDGFDLLCDTIQLPSINVGDHIIWPGMGYKVRSSGPHPKFHFIN